MERMNPNTRVVLSMKVGPLEKLSGVELYIEHVNADPGKGGHASNVVFIVPSAFARQLRDQLDMALTE